jgi:hypothetical protein
MTSGGRRCSPAVVFMCSGKQYQRDHKSVMRGRDPRIHRSIEMDCRVKPGNDNFVY